MTNLVIFLISKCQGYLIYWPSSSFVQAPVLQTGPLLGWCVFYSLICYHFTHRRAVVFFAGFFFVKTTLRDLGNDFRLSQGCIKCPGFLTTWCLTDCPCSISFVCVVTRSPLSRRWSGSRRRRCSATTRRPSCATPRAQGPLRAGQATRGLPPNPRSSRHGGSKVNYFLHSSCMVYIYFH